MLILGLQFGDILTNFLKVIYTFFLICASLIYSIFDVLYQIFMAIASARIFSQDNYINLANKIYVVIGVVALFFVAYALLRAIADPEGAAKGEMAVGKIIPNILKAIILIAFVPTIFNIAYKVQDTIFSTHVIENLLFDTDALPSDSFSNIGHTMGNEVFISFFYPTSKTAGDACSNSNFNFDSCLESEKIEKEESSSILRILAYSNPVTAAYAAIYDFVNFITKSNDNQISLKDIYNQVNETGEYIKYEPFAVNAADGSINYNWIMQGLVGCFLIYVFLNFCIDLGVRAIKLVYYQLIAPIPILTIIIPGQKKIFDNWKKGTISTFLEVFIRVIIVVFCIYMIQHLPSASADIWSNSLLGEPSAFVRIMARAFIIIGILIFMKQAPKLISDMFGISSGSFKLGIGEKLGEMAFVGGAAKNAMNTGKGYVTGGLGGAFQGLRTGGVKGLKAGALLGAANGSKSGGNQFGKQRDAFVQRYFNDSSAKASLFNSVDKDGNKKAGVAGGFAAKNKNAFNEYLKNNQNKNFAAVEAKNQSDLELNTNSANSRYESSVVSANARATSEKEAAKTLFDNNMSRLTQKYNEDRATAQTIFDQANASYKSGAKSYLTSEKEKQWQQYARNNNISTNDLSRYSSEHDAFNNNKELDNKIMDEFIAKSPEAAEYRTALQNLNSIDNRFKQDSQTIQANYDNKISSISSANEQTISNATETRDTAINAAQNTFDTTSATIAEDKKNTIEGRLQTSGDQFSAQAAENKKLSKALEEFMKNNMSDTIKPPSSDSGDKPSDNK